MRRFCRRRQMPLVSRLRPDAALYAAPRPPKPGHRWTLVGRRLDSPRQAVSRRNAPWRRTTVPWYGGQTRKVWLLTDTGIWYRRGRKPMWTRWVYVVDREGQHQDTCLFCTDPALSPQQIIALFIGRWSIEVTFEKKPGPPTSFTWRDEEYAVVEVLRAWTDHGFGPFRKGGRWWQRRHRDYFRVRTEDGGVASGSSSAYPRHLQHRSVSSPR
jgi:hypothetical protein